MKGETYRWDGGSISGEWDSNGWHFGDLELVGNEVFGRDL